MKRLLLGSSVLIGVGALAGTAHASDGIKLEVGGFFNQTYEGVFDKKSGGHFGYAVDAWKFGAQFSHGWYDGTTGTAGDGFGTAGHKTLNHAIVTAGYALAPGVLVDASLGYTWYHDTRDATASEKDHYHGFSAAIGSALTF